MLKQSCLLFYLVILCGSFILFPFFSVKEVFILSVIQSVLFSVYIYKKEKIISFFLIFWLISHFFSMSYLFIPNDPDIGSLIPFYLTTPDEVILKKAAIFAFYCHAFFSLGYLLYSMVPKKNRTTQNEKIQNEKTVSLIPQCFVIIGLFPKTFLLAKYLMLYRFGGYRSVITYVPNGIFSFLASLFDVGILLIIAHKYSHNKKILLPSIVFFLYQLLFVITGKRGGAISNVLAFFIIILSKKDSFLSLKNIIRISILICIALIGLPLLSKIRAVSNSGDRIEFLRTFFIENSDIVKLSFFSVCSEFGSAFLTIYYSIMYFSIPNLGYNYLVSFITIIPLTGSISSFVNSVVLYKNKLPITETLGGSYIGEAYYSFGIMGFVIFLLIGFILAFVSKKITYGIRKNKIRSLLIYLPLIPNLLWWIRDFFGPIVRPFVWIIMLVYILPFFFKYLKTKEALYD